MEQRAKRKVLKPHSFKVWIRTTDLWVMGPARYLCATLNSLTLSTLHVNSQFERYINAGKVTHVASDA